MDNQPKPIGREEVDPLLRLLETTSRADLARLASTPEQLAVLWGPQPDLVEAAAVALGGFWVPRHHRDVDLVVAVADGRWTLEQLREQVLSATRVAAMQRRVIVVCGIDGLDRAGFDLLLKTLEEPVAGLHFLLTCSNPARLPNTIAGRVGTTVAVRAVHGETRRDMLVQSGWQPQAASTAVRIAVPARWLPLVGEKPELLDVFGEILQIGVRSEGTPARRAASLVSAMESLAVAGTAAFGSGEAGTRAARRALVEWLFEHLAGSAQALSWEDTTAAGARLTALAGAREQLSRNASLPLVLTALLITMEPATTRAAE
jgi:hypothetical protein